MKTFGQFLIATLIATTAGFAGAATLYKWIDENGNITYQDTPPPDNVEFEANEVSGVPLPPLEGDTGQQIDQAALDNPVTLYAIPICDACDLTRLLLESNSIPFAEKNVRNNIDVQAELENIAGTVTVPTLVVGEKNLQGFRRPEITALLTEAGFPVLDPAEPKEPVEEEQPEVETIPATGEDEETEAPTAELIPSNSN